MQVHPRERGESVEQVKPWEAAAGPSPRARGILLRAHDGRHRPGSIPASAGNPNFCLGCQSGDTVHPRERGESCTALGVPLCGGGPSPRARGIQCDAEIRTRSSGSIPASAGNPVRNNNMCCPAKVHPRERGESPPLGVVGCRRRGPSPRARGIRYRRERSAKCGGSIPASAGNPGCSRRSRRMKAVHPRERGESWDVRASPDCGLGSIPASAGNPLTHSLPHSIQGPSPRARGILRTFSPKVHPRERGEFAGFACAGSIPASAGNPGTHEGPEAHTGVHPRERGESIVQARRRVVLRGSIPASAGNPALHVGRPATARVHPRERGESKSKRLAAPICVGPSPRARGIPTQNGRPPHVRGSIPASAGNPLTR